jgi:hypothetical protein
MSLLDELCESRLLGDFLEGLRNRYGGYELVDNWQQGELHHDVVLRMPADAVSSLARIVVVSINCNGGIKEVLGFDDLPERPALWHHRCPDNPAFAGTLPPIRCALRTEHWLEPGELLASEA